MRLLFALSMEVDNLQLDLRPAPRLSIRPADNESVEVRWPSWTDNRYRLLCPVAYDGHPGRPLWPPASPAGFQPGQSETGRHGQRWRRDDLRCPERTGGGAAPCRGQCARLPVLRRWRVAGSLRSRPPNRLEGRHTERWDAGEVGEGPSQCSAATVTFRLACAESHGTQRFGARPRLSDRSFPGDGRSGWGLSATSPTPPPASRRRRSDARRFRPAWSGRGRPWAESAEGCPKSSCPARVSAPSSTPVPKSLPAPCRPPYGPSTP